MHEDVAACAAIVEKGDPDRFRATMAAPVALREKLFPLYAFNVEVARAPWLTNEPMIAEMRLQWWRDALEEMRAKGPVRRHEVTTPLSEGLDSKSVDFLDELISARRWDIYKEPFSDNAHFKRYLEQTAGHLLAVALRLVAHPDDDLAKQAGYVHGLSNWLRAVPFLEASGRFPLVDGRTSAVAELAQDGLLLFQKLRPRLRALPKDARAVFLPLWQVESLLSRAADDPEKVAAGALEVAPLRQQLGLMKAVVFGL